MDLPFLLARKPLFDQPLASGLQRGLDFCAIPVGSRVSGVLAMSWIEPGRPHGSRQDANDQARPSSQQAGLATMRTLLAPNLGCADNDLAGIRRQCFYLAFLIGRSKSIHTYAFLRLFAVHSFPTPCINNAQTSHNRDRDLHSPGGVHAFLRVQHFGCRMLFIRFVNRAVQAIRRSHPRRAAAGKR